MLMIDYLGLINSSHGVLAESVIFFSINIRIRYRSSHVTSDVTPIKL